MKNYKIGDFVKTKDGEFKVLNVETLVNPFDMEEETVITVDYNGLERKINNDSIIE